MSMKHTKGFSLMELMAVIAVAGILIALGVPGMVTVVQNNRILATSNDFISAVHAGRMESIKRRSTVVLCASEVRVGQLEAGHEGAIDARGRGLPRPAANLNALRLGGRCVPA